jgi:hypothetical protein
MPANRLVAGMGRAYKNPVRQWGQHRITCKTNMMLTNL